MATRIVEGQLPYTGGTGIGIDGNKVISVLLREENNLILVNDDNELYTDLQLADGIAPTDTFPVGVTVGKVLAADGWTQNGLLLNWKTTSGDYARWIYGANGEIYFDGGIGTWNQVYYSSEVDDLFTALRAELATVAFTGDYNDLINRPEFLQQQADWDETDNTKPDYIKNKPTIPTVNDATLTIQKNNISQGTFTANSSTNTTINIPVPNVYDNLTSTSTSDALSANQGKILNEKIQNLEGIGRFLSLWDASTGQPISFPLSTPYNYQTGDYYLVETIDTTAPIENYRPNGSQYTGSASNTPENEELEVGDLYIYDGTTWLLQINHGKTVSFANLAGQPSDNANLATALNAKADTSSISTVGFSGDYGDLLNKPTIPSGQVNSDWNASSGVAEILNKPTIPTDTNQLTNGAGYITASYHDSSKQDTLVSGTNIKTINNTSILGSGDITISGGSEIEYKTQAEYNALLPGAASDGKHYFIYTPSIINVTGVTLDESSISLTTPNQTYQLTATVSPNDATDKSVTWSSSDDTIATVSQTGLVTCVAPGTCTITVTTTDGGFTATCGVDAGGWQPGVNTLGYYPFKSDIKDYSGNNNDFTTGTGTYANNMITTTSNLKGASPVLNGYSGNFTYSVWIDYSNTDTTTTTEISMCCDSTYAPSLTFRGTNNDGWVGGIFTNTWGVPTYTGTLTGIHCIHLVRDSGTLYLYIDGSEVNSTSVSGSITNHSKTIVGGYQDTFKQVTCGNLIVENKARTAREISDYYDQTKGDYGIS